MSEARQALNDYDRVELVTYELVAPDVWEPPRNHKRTGDGEFVGPWEPGFDLLDEFGTIRVTDWGGSE